MTLSSKRKIYIRSSQKPERPRQCPACLTIHDAVTEISTQHKAPGPPQPKPGDVTFCSQCGTVLVFTRDNFRIATAEEHAALSPDLHRVMEVWEQLRQKRKGESGRQ